MIMTFVRKVKKESKLLTGFPTLNMRLPSLCMQALSLGYSTVWANRAGGQSTIRLWLITSPQERTAFPVNREFLLNLLNSISLNSIIQGAGHAREHIFAGMARSYIDVELTVRFGMKKIKTHCDIFCNVIDNYGDIGVCWRLARQLANEHGLAVRLWVDDLSSLVKLCPEADDTLASQHRRGVEVRLWSKNFPEVQPADLVIEAFACVLPESYIAAMAAQAQQPAWINLEYLSGEDLVHGCHKLPSPHPSLPLVKYFFFPGFTKLTGGLLLERDLLARRDAFQNDAVQQQAFWQSIGMKMPAAEALKISLFGYENAALHGLFDAWTVSAQPVLCLVPEGRILPQVGQYFGDNAPHAGSDYARGNLQVRVLPFVEQERFDPLLWACDINFVRGEDSCVRALWVGRPFIWQIYPQHDVVH